VIDWFLKVGQPTFFISVRTFFNKKGYKRIFLFY
jgi:hypothetical protein